MVPVISVEYSMDSDEYTLVATSYSVTNPAGPRLFRGGELPDVQWCHSNEAEANRDRDLLQRYLNDVHSGKSRKAKRGAEEAVIETEMSVDTTNAIWNL